MKKGNRTRFFIWGLVWVMLIASSLYGIILYFEGYGKTGQLRQKLSPIADAFNNLEGLNSYKNAGMRINAIYEDDKIVVEYTNLKNTSKYTFQYEKKDDDRILKAKFNQADENNAKVITKAMIDAVSIVNGFYEGDTWKKFSLDDLYRTSVSEGASLSISNTSIIVEINLDKSVIDYVNIDDLTKTYLTSKDLNNMSSSLNENNYFTYTKGSTILYVENYEEKYDIYLQNGEYNDDLYKSILAVIDKLEIEQVIKDEFQISYPIISTSKSFGNYTVTVNADGSSISAFSSSNDNIIRVEIKK